MYTYTHVYIHIYSIVLSRGGLQQPNAGGLGGGLGGDLPRGLSAAKRAYDFIIIIIISSSSSSSMMIIQLIPTPGFLPPGYSSLSCVFLLCPLPPGGSPEVGGGRNFLTMFPWSGYVDVQDGCV